MKASSSSCPSLAMFTRSPSRSGRSVLSQIRARLLKCINCHYQLFTTRTPYPDVRHDYSVTLRVLRGDRPDRPSSSDSQDVGLHERLWDTMESGWDADPLRRPSLAAFLAAVWKENQGSAADWLEVDFAEILNELKRIGEGWRAVYNPSTQGQPDVGLVHTLRHDRYDIRLCH
jgi:hypothetical protein